MAITSLPKRKGMSDAEWTTRCDLAALYRILHHLRMTDLIYTHMTARIPDEDGTFLINNYGELFEANIGEATPIGLARGLNAQWTDGGLIYSPPFR